MKNHEANLKNHENQPRTLKTQETTLKTITNVSSGLKVTSWAAHIALGK